MIKKENKKTTKKSKTKENLKKNTKNIKEEKNIIDENIVGEKLTEKQKLFCFHYICNDMLRGNGTLCYNEAYLKGLEDKSRSRLTDIEGKEIYGTSEYDKCYNSCSASASTLLRNFKIQQENTRLLNELLNDQKVDSKLAEIIFTGKHADSLNAIKEYNKIKGRIEEKLNINGAVATLDTEDLEIYQKIINKNLKG